MAGRYTVFDDSRDDMVEPATKQSKLRMYLSWG